MAVIAESQTTGRRIEFGRRMPIRRIAFVDTAALHVVFQGYVHSFSTFNRIQMFGRYIPCVLASLTIVQ